MNPTGIIGGRAEKLALKFLRKQRLVLIEANFNCRYGEIDLIMRDGDYLVFIEVRYRKDQRFGGALQSIDRRKQSKLRRSAEHYLLQKKRTDCACRFDVLCVSGSLFRPSYDWIENAF